MEWSSDADMIRPWENSRHVTIAVPWAGNERCFGCLFVTQRDSARSGEGRRPEEDRNWAPFGSVARSRRSNGRLLLVYSP